MSKALDVIAAVDVELSLTPMIDVTFLLLIYFMVTSKFKKSEGKIDAFLPRDRGLGTSSPQAVTETRIKLLWYDLNENRPTNADVGRCVLKIGKRVFPSVYYRDDYTIIDRKRVNLGSPDFGALRDYLANAKLEWKPPRGADAKKGMPVIIDARTKVPFRFVVRSLNACLEAGLQDITFAAAANPIQ